MYRYFAINKFVQPSRLAMLGLPKTADFEEMGLKFEVFGPEKDVFEGVLGLKLNKSGRKQLLN